jgi:adenylate cyclase
VRRAGSGFDLDLLPISQVKGKDKGVQTYRVTGLERTDGGQR